MSRADTDLILTMSRTMVNGSGRSNPSRTIRIVIFVPFFPRIRCTASTRVMLLVVRHASLHSGGGSVGQIATI
jgi:hypothetical protein